MTSGRRKWGGVLILLIGLGLIGSPRTVAAQGRCAQDLRDCYLRASHMRYWTDQWLAGIDCELDFVDCARRKLIGR